MLKNKNLLLLGLLAILATSGCTTKTEIRYAKPMCEAPPQPALPSVNAGDLWDRIGQGDYDTLAIRESLLVDWAMEMQSMINILCVKPGESLR